MGLIGLGRDLREPVMMGQVDVRERVGLTMSRRSLHGRGGAD